MVNLITITPTRLQPLNSLKFYSILPVHPQFSNFNNSNLSVAENPDQFLTRSLKQTRPKNVVPTPHCVLKLLKLIRKPHQAVEMISKVLMEHFLPVLQKEVQKFEDYFGNSFRDFFGQNFLSNSVVNFGYNEINMRCRVRKFK